MTQETSELFERIRFRGQPVANPKSVVVCGSARFTMLTPRLIRLEWSETGEFEDRGTFAFPTRHAPPPHFVSHVDRGLLMIEGDLLTLRYKLGSGQFSADNLSIAFELNGKRQTWVPTQAQDGQHALIPTSAPSNLRGTRRTLDRCYGDSALEEGLLSRAGWSLFDDSRSVLFDTADGWAMPRPSHKVQDWYFFGYGHDYKGALSDYALFGGSIPLVPRFALGAWWSRYWAYTDADLKELVRDFEKHGLPLDVLVIDMDWHTPHSWTGCTWNRELFPDPPAFLKWVHDKGLRVSLNLHPAEGVQPFEEIYPRFAEAMGQDPAEGKAIPFRITDWHFVKNYFELIHHPLEDDGIDFWWVDWQQGETSEMQGLDPLPWLNHLHFSDSTRRGLRPMLYSRWGGLGNHRYPMGFSGDTYVGWPALQFQPYFTATASNVAYGWWGHDIGGHMGNATEPELYARWLQFGALSPCLRPHATKDPRAERRPWKYPEGVFQAAKAAYQLRYQLLPYIYTMARAAHDTGISLCRPMYYEYPEEDAAYTARYQYFFGDQIIAAPIVHPADPNTGLANTDVWIPEGTWIDYATKETFSGPRWIRLLGDLRRMPMLVRSAAILPLAMPLSVQPSQRMASGTTDSLSRDRLILSIFPGEHGAFRLYDDDGTTEAFREGQCEWVEVTTRMDSPDIWVIHISPVEGRCDLLPDQQGYEIRLEGSRQPDKVVLNGTDISNWDYDAEALTTTIHVPMRDKSEPLTITAVAGRGISALGDDHNRQLLLSDVQRLLGNTSMLPWDGWCDGGGPETLLDALTRMDTTLHPDLIARLGGPFVRFLEFTAPEEATQQLGRIIIGAPSHPEESFDYRVTWTLFQGHSNEQRTSRYQGATGPQILDCPFAFDGRVRTMQWTAEITFTWRGVTLIQTHRSSVLFPTIYALHACVYDQDEDPLPLKRVLDDHGDLNDDLDWRTYSQTSDGLVNLGQPHGVMLSHDYRPELEADTPLAAYIATSITSPDDREAVVEFRSSGPTEFYLNGLKVDELLVAQESWLPGLLRKARRTETMRLHAGRNTLLVHTRPPQEKRLRWYFGGMLRTPRGEPMTDITYE